MGCVRGLQRVIGIHNAALLDDRSPRSRFMREGRYLKYLGDWDGPPVVDRFSVLGQIAETTHGSYYLGYDPGLDRNVWLHMEKGASEAAREIDVLASSDDGTGVRLHRIESGSTPDGTHFDVYEDPGGSRAGGYVRDEGRIQWNALRLGLIALCKQLASPRPARWMGQLWVDRNQRLRVLEYPLLKPKGPTHELTPLELLSEVTRAMQRYYPCAPIAIDRVQQRLMGGGDAYESVDDARLDLESLPDHSKELTFGQLSIPVTIVASLGFANIAILLWVDTMSAVDAGRARGILAAVVIGIGILCTAAAYCLRGSLWCHLVGLDIRIGERPERASRLRCCVRAGLSWAGVVVIALFLPSILGGEGQAGLKMQQFFYGVAISLPFVVRRSTQQTLADRLLKTFVVTR
jgi:hypothetical protein